MTLKKNRLITLLLTGLYLVCFTAFKVNAKGLVSTIPMDTAVLHPTDSTINTYDIYGGDPRIAACPNFGGDEGFGQLTIGIRAGACTLLDPASIGFGLGLAIRYRLAKQWSIEGYADKFKTTIQHLGYRTDDRYGINALYYWAYRPLRVHKFTRFLLGGLSYETIVIYSYHTNAADYGNKSPWLDLGVGEHYRMARHWDWTLEFFYDMPLATHPASYLYTPEIGPQFLKARYQNAFNIGGIFGILSLNYTFGYM